VPGQVRPSQRKRPAHLTLAPEILRFGRGYAEAHHTSLSGVVEALLGALEQTVATRGDPVTRDPLDGLLVGWPDLDKTALRAFQQQARPGP